MTEYLSSLDHEAQRVSADGAELAKVQHRVLQRRRYRRWGSTTLGIAIAAAGIGVAWSAFDAPSTRVPKAGPTNSPTPGSTPEVLAAPVEGPSLYIDNRTGIQGLEDSVGTLIERPFSVWGSSGGGDKPRSGQTHLLFVEGSESIAREIRDEWFPGAPIREGAPKGLYFGGPPLDLEGPIDFEQLEELAQASELPPNPPDVTLVLAPDYLSYRIVEGIDVHRFLSAFAGERNAGQGAEAFLSAEALARYSDHDDGLQLYTYWPEGQEFRLNTLEHRDDGTYEAGIEVDPRVTDEPRPIIIETVTVESRPDGDFWITYAERDP